MVELVVETGVGVPGANSFVSLEYADEYFAAHPFYSDSWADLTEPRRKVLLVAGTSRVASLVQWGGQPANTGQALPWPRYGVVNPDGAYYGTTIIPEALKQATCEMAYWLSTPGANPDQADSTSGVEEIKMDVIGIKFSGSTPKRAAPLAVVALLRGLGNSYFGGRVRRVNVGLA